MGYLVLYDGFSALVVGPPWGDRVSEDLLGDPSSVFVVLLVPILFGALVLLAFTACLGWLEQLLGRQPIGGPRWMWVAVVLTVVPIALRLVGINYAAFDPSVIALTFASGLLIGFTEELLTRGIAVRVLRSAGYRERAVALISSALFALLHSSNVFLGQAPLTVALTVVFAFGFGMMMYLVLRVTRSLVWPILIHGLTDPTTFLGSGGVDVATTDPSPLVALAGPFNIVFIAVALIALLLVRGRVGAPAPSAELGR
ncbi:CPBP family intramembrane glutamic endopeptidase [Miniimonas sp. S16]|uniref:CPBP family intramembrane glutamic endopeptidase n=1 Tax=Miniimonas sp. S16 TaxID=2171623 RepID=UPI001F3774B9|nr:CPBP family intramembrane glutamic endopeptidase [Miniimonas sp. S16]